MAKVKTGVRGFSLIEMMIVVAVIGILTAIAYPTYTKYLVRVSRESAQTTLLQLANLEEKIYLNSSAYTASVTSAYTGSSSGGLGLTAGTTSDGKYTITATSGTSATFTLTATPVTGTSQALDGTITINQAGTRTWGSASW